MIDALQTIRTMQGESAITFVETQQVKEGVVCEIYTFVNDSSKDLAVVRIKAGSKTPLQKILKGTETIEGFMRGTGSLNITSADGSKREYAFDETSNAPQEIVVHVGERMQWSAKTDLTFYEICMPPYEDGRFENLPEPR